MPRLETAQDVDAWFGEYGWFPGRDVAGLVPAILADVTEDARRKGFPLEPFAAATEFLTEHAGLRLTIDARRGDHLHLTPALLWHSTAGDIAELSRHLGARLFPVGWDSSEGSPFVIDEQGRFFYLHHTGDYYMGADKHEAMIGLAHAPMRDAEDHFA
ncbi:SUKH-3 domain-containing protein [Streptomyces globisporus]|uniref:SUKH-3 domain-containing protein n=1 Tax=Streptomyces globisporus TaxID=1908 RepID=UPI0004C9E11E|nr:SUKH-3 domain-containing protein [Streptomyces globisporus]